MWILLQGTLIPVKYPFKPGILCLRIAVFTMYFHIVWKCARELSWHCPHEPEACMSWSMNWAEHIKRYSHSAPPRSWCMLASFQHKPSLEQYSTKGSRPCSALAMNKHFSTHHCILSNLTLIPNGHLSCHDTHSFVKNEITYLAFDKSIKYG